MGEKQIGALGYSVRARVVLKHTGRLMAVLSVLALVSMLVSVLYGEYGFTVSIALVSAFLAAAGLLLGRIKAPVEIQPNEALVITALIFVLAAIVMSYPMTVSGLSFDDALFESVSAITTTGLSTLTEVEGMPKSFLFSRSWMQWTGGLGIVVLSVALVMGPGIASKRLLGLEGEAADILGGTRAYARAMLKVYLTLTVIGVSLIAATGVSWFDSVVHALSAVSTGGFSSMDAGLAGLGGWAPAVAVTVVSMSGAVTLALYHKVYTHGVGSLARDVELRALVLFSLATALLVLVCLRFLDGLGWAGAAGHAPLIAVSAQSTTGFSTLDVPSLSGGTKLLLVFSMMVGGSVGSTAGGMKLFRVLIFFKLARLTVARTSLPPHAVSDLRLEGQRLGPEEIERALLVMSLFISIVFLSVVPFVIMGYEPLDSLFEVVSATATVGLSAGITGHGLPPFLKGVLCADMVLGRLEILAVLVVFYPGTWIGRRGKSA